MPSKTTKKNAKPSKLSWLTGFTRSKLFIPALFLLAFAVVGGFMIFSTNAAPRQRCCTVPTAYFNPSSASVRVGETFVAEIWVDSMNVEVNAVQADFSYPTSNLEFVSFEDRSDFEVQAQADVGSGTIRIARGSTTMFTGKHLVAAVKLKAVAAGKNVKLTFLPETAAAGPGSNFQNAIEKTIGSTYSIR